MDAFKTKNHILIKKYLKDGFNPNFYIRDPTITMAEFFETNERPLTNVTPIDLAVHQYDILMVMILLENGNIDINFGSLYVSYIDTIMNINAYMIEPPESTVDEITIGTKAVNYLYGIFDLLMMYGTPNLSLTSRVYNISIEQCLNNRYYTERIRNKLLESLTRRNALLKLGAVSKKLPIGFNNKGYHVYNQTYTNNSNNTGAGAGAGRRGGRRRNRENIKNNTLKKKIIL